MALNMCRRLFPIMLEHILIESRARRAQKKRQRGEEEVFLDSVDDETHLSVVVVAVAWVCVSSKKTRSETRLNGARLFGGCLCFSDYFRLSDNSLHVRHSARFLNVRSVLNAKHIVDSERSLRRRVNGWRGGRQGMESTNLAGIFVLLRGGDGFAIFHFLYTNIALVPAY